MADIPEYEGDDDIIEHYENQESDDERGSRGEAEDATSDNETGTARRIDPSKSKSKSHVVRNPVPKLNTERLTGPNGIQTIEKYFEGFKFYSKGHEKTDLDRIMKRLEHWSYRLFPNYHFDDFLTRLEQLGTKKDLQVFIKKYRLDMITKILSTNLITNDSDKDDEDGQEQSAPLDDFDLLITEQIQKQKKIERNKQLAIQRRLQRQKEREEEVKRTKFDDMNVETLNESNNLTVHNEMNISQVDSIPSQINENINEAIVVLRQYYQMKNQ
ncbi:Protein TIPIN like protein [Trachymyrmex cornetzi]|uniref:TIMELESS-interacting protein n=1 Tax=Trachymyrmex cornetzi TaxID=471704 RepID=A0A195EEY7_9HYME|nr:Protein TIPIN like protein [Trachymyrmex cornetzi]